jgi:hypothetical protein
MPLICCLPTPVNASSASADGISIDRFVDSGSAATMETKAVFA